MLIDNIHVQYVGFARTSQRPVREFIPPVTNERLRLPLGALAPCVSVEVR